MRFVVRYDSKRQLQHEAVSCRASMKPATVQRQPAWKSSFSAISEAAGRTCSTERSFSCLLKPEGSVKTSQGENNLLSSLLNQLSLGLINDFLERSLFGFLLLLRVSGWMAAGNGRTGTRFSTRNLPIQWFISKPPIEHECWRYWHLTNCRKLKINVTYKCSFNLLLISQQNVLSFMMQLFKASDL